MNADHTISESTGKTATDCPLSDREQTRNIILYAATNSLVYLAAPVLYVGLVQAVLFDKLGADKTTANLPANVALYMQPIPVLIAWFIPYVRHLKTVIVVAFSADMVVGAMVVLALLSPNPDWVVSAVLLHACFPGRYCRHHCGVHVGNVGAWSLAVTPGTGLFTHFWCGADPRRSGTIRRTDGA